MESIEEAAGAELTINFDVNVYKKVSLNGVSIWLQMTERRSRLGLPSLGRRNPL